MRPFARGGDEWVGCAVRRQWIRLCIGSGAVESVWDVRARALQATCLIPGYAEEADCPGASFYRVLPSESRRRGRDDEGEPVRVRKIGLALCSGNATVGRLGEQGAALPRPSGWQGRRQAAASAARWRGEDGRRVVNRRNCSS